MTDNAESNESDVKHKKEAVEETQQPSSDNDSASTKDDDEEGGEDENKTAPENENDTFLKDIIKRLLEWTPPTQKSTKSQVLRRREIIRLCQLAVASFSAQPSFLRIDKEKLPITICADLHGQFVDLKLMLHECGRPPSNTWLFLGDYVDRGRNGMEIICLLFALKIIYPDRCFMLRGNHEDYNTTMVYGFYDECLEKYGDEDRHLVWLSFVNVFNHMPMVALVGDRVLAMHGGISPCIHSLNDLTKIQRPTLIPMYGLACDLLWSDPGAAHPGWSASSRAVSFSFDDSVVDTFCRQHDIDLIVRGHQINDAWRVRGYNLAANCKLVTIFSAPNYLGNGNTGALINISKKMECKFYLFRPKRVKDSKRN